MKPTVFRQVLSVFALLAIAGPAFTAPAIKDSSEAYNEFYLPDGQLRPQYQFFAPYLQASTPEIEEKYMQWSRKAFQKDNAQYRFPRVLIGDEYDAVLKKGVHQRAEALQAFLRDHYSGQKAYAKAGVVSEETINRIIARTGEAAYQGKIDPNIIAFMYGPDIIRDKDGVWRVIEDNPGFIGGLGDLERSYSIMMKTFSDLPKALAPLRQPSDFYKDLAQEFKERAAQMGGKAIMYMVPPYADNEDSRLKSLFAAEGIESIEPGSRKKLVIKEDGAYLKSPGPGGKDVLEKVGFVFMNGEHAWLDDSSQASQERNILDAANSYIKENKKDRKTAKKIQQILNKVNPQTHMPDLAALKNILRTVGALDLNTSHVRGLNRLILEKKVATNYSPGVDFIGDKEFYVYLEDMIRFYLHEEPIIRNIETQRFALPDGSVNEALIEKTFANLSTAVIKRVDGRGGDAVWVGPKINQAQIPALQQLIRSAPEVYIAQKFTPLSVMNGNIIDTRVITYISPTKIIVTNTPWGRGVPKNGNGKVNLSDKGFEVTTLVTDSIHGQLRCEDVF